MDGRRIWAKNTPAVAQPGYFARDTSGSVGHTLLCSALGCACILRRSYDRTVNYRGLAELPCKERSNTVGRVPRRACASTTRNQHRCQR
eukprot:1182802-Prorocentrum_minimum.AAC.3